MLSLLLLQVAAPDLQLTCVGNVTGAIPVETTSVNAQSAWGSTANASGVRSEIATAEVSVGFRLQGGKAQLRIPSELLPQWRGGKNGWFEVRDLMVSEREITGKVAVNIFMRPTFRIDRYTGELSSSGGFQGKCQTQDVTERKF